MRKLDRVSFLSFLGGFLREERDDAATRNVAKKDLTPAVFSFVFAVGLYGEPFSQSHLFSFCCIWAALAVYTADALWRGLGRSTDKHKRTA